MPNRRAVMAWKRKAHVGGLLLAALLGGVWACAPKHVPELKTVQGDGASFVYDAYYFSECRPQALPRLTSHEIGTDIPLEVLPARSAFLLLPRQHLAKGHAVRPSFVNNTLAVIPLSDTTVANFAEAYPNLNAQAQRLAQALARRPNLPETGKRRDLPDIAEVDCQREIIGKPQYLDFASGSGVLFLTQYVQEFNVIRNQELAYVFQGLTQDRNYYIDARFAVGHPTLDRGPRGAETWKEARQTKYLRHIEEELDHFPESSFQPPLYDLKAILASLRLAAVNAEREKK